MEKNKWILILLIGVVLVFLFKGGFNLGSGSTMAAGDISSAIITRTLSATEVQPSTTFTATYTPSGAGTGSWGVLISDAVSGGCTPATYNGGLLSTDTPLSKLATYTAPASGTCTFTGNYQFSAGTIGNQGNIAGTTTISVINCVSLKTSAISADRKSVV